MTVAVNLASLMSGAYVRDIQDALGRGASVAVTSGAQDSVKITGTPTGEGLKIEAQALQASTRAKASTYDTISLSPAAQASLDQQKIALTLLVQGQAGRNGRTEGQKPPETVSAAPQSGNSSDAVDATDVVALSHEDPTQLVKDLVGAVDTVASQLCTMQGFQAAAASDPSFLQTFAKGIPDGLGDSFLAAFANGTVTIQSGKDAGIGSGGGVLISGTGESSIVGSNTGSFHTGLTSTTNSVGAGFGFTEQAMFSWPKTDTELARSTVT